MAVVIRLARVGTKNSPKYRVMVADSRKHSTTKFLDIVGSYIPKHGVQKPQVVLDVEKIQAWIKKGAQPTDRVAHLLKNLGK